MVYLLQLSSVDPIGNGKRQGNMKQKRKIYQQKCCVHNLKLYDTHFFKIVLVYTKSSLFIQIKQTARHFSRFVYLQEPLRLMERRTFERRAICNCLFNLFPTMYADSNRGANCTRFPDNYRYIRYDTHSGGNVVNFDQLLVILPKQWKIY